MEPHSTPQDVSQHDNDFDNIIRINYADDTEDLQDFDFDYDPNEMYYALVNDKD